MECLFSLRLQYWTDLPLRPLQYYEYVIAKYSIYVTFSTQFVTNVIAPLAKAVAVNLPGPRITANHRECTPLQGKSISDGFTWRRTGMGGAILGVSVGEFPNHTSPGHASSSSSPARIVRVDACSLVEVRKK